MTLVNFAEKAYVEKHRTKRVNLVLIGGKLTTGKTTSANYIQDTLTMKYPSLPIEHTAFAKPIKEIAYSVFHWDGQKDEKGRRLLQVIGTEAGREYNSNIWVEYLENYIVGGLFIPNIVLVDDWRFPNEKEYFANNIMFDLTTIRINRNTGVEDSHSSENSLTEDKSYYDFVIDNNGSLEELYNKLDGIISHLSNKIITY